MVATPFAVSPAAERMLPEAMKIAEDVSGPAADAVDAEGRFPHESIAALKEARLLSSFVPVELGGDGCTISDLAAVCYVLGRRCGSSAMVFAMHQIQAACLVHHGLGMPELRAHAERLVDEQRLLGSATTEAGVGGNVRTSICAVENDGSTYRVFKDAPVISYGDHADDIFVTARRAADAAASDQVIIVVRKQDATLEPTLGWDTLGMRGTCSTGYRLNASGPAGLVFPLPYADISARTMLPVTHILWSSLWLGIAADAVDRARRYLRAQARSDAGTLPAIAPDVARLYADLETHKALVASTAAHYETIESDPVACTSTTTTLRMNSLKTTMSAAAVKLVTDALYVCGIAAYRNDTEYSLGRHLRDAHSAALMVHNERILSNSGRLLCVHKEDQ